MSKWPGQIVSGKDDDDERWPGEPVEPAQQKRGSGGPLYDVQAVDGDTLKTAEARVRLWGADAPELAQQGWDHLGNAVPIGQQSKDWLQGSINNAGNVRLGNVQGMSYGRLVGPVTLDGNDAALTSIRTGNALAAPAFVRDNPGYRSELMQAERLARLNGLGPLNDNYVPQTPAKFRHAGPVTPERETVAQFFDTPTPLQGLPADKEVQLRKLYETGTAAEINAFLSANGYQTSRPADLAAFIAKRDKGAKVDPSVTYNEAPPLMIDSGDGASGALYRKFGSGFLSGGLDEAGAFVDMLGLTPGRESVFNSDRRLADIWVNNQRQNAGILSYDQTVHPTASTVGEVAGGLTSGFVIPYGAGARGALQLGKVGAVYGAAGGFLSTDGSVSERLKGAVIGAPVGMVLNTGIGKAIEAVAPAIGRGVNRLLGRDATKAAEAAGEVAGEYVNDDAFNAAEALPDGATGDVWPGREVGSDGSQDAGVGVAAPDSGGTPSSPGWEEFQRDGSDRFLIYHGPEGQQAYVHVSIGDDGVADISVDPFSKDANRFGPGVVRQAARDLKQLYPEIRALRGERETGAHPGRVQSMEMGESGYPEGTSPWHSALGEGGTNPRVAEVSPTPDSQGTPRAIGMEADSPFLAARPRDYIDINAGPRPLLDPITEAQRAAAAARMRPADVLPIPSNAVDGPEDLAAAEAGRFAEATAPNERGELDRGVVRSWYGADVPKVGPTDMIGWLRLRGGLKNEGSELGQMGFTNAARRGLDHVGQEARFGPLVNNKDGANLDDAAHDAWEAGFFPEHTERPSVNEFLDALRDTYNGGSGRRFLPDDLDQLERYSAAQSDRYQLEQQQHEVGGPVYQDRSMPADDAAPFPPPQAYDEWPSDAIQRVGNVDVTKLDSPQDIRRALRTSYNAMGAFDAATRGRVTQAETERLASEIGMTANDLLSRRKGQALNAEEALASRQILAKSGNELVNLAKRIKQLETPGDDLSAAFQQALMRHSAIQEQVSGMTAEAGRTLAQFKMMANSRAVPREVLASMATTGGGAGRISEAADALLEAVEQGPGVFNTKARQLGNPRFADKQAELLMSFILSRPTTHIVNMASNTLTALAQLPEHAAASAIGAGRQLVARRSVDRVLAGEVGARTFGLIQGAKEGALLFAKALKTGESSDLYSKVQGNEMRAISGLKGEIIRTPLRLLTAEDELFKGMARRMEINGLAYRQAHAEGLRGEDAAKRIAELTTNPTDEMMERALDYSRYLTFQRPLKGTGGDIANAVRRNPWLRPVITFVRTPVNLLKFAVERSPAALALKEWRADVKAGGARRDLALARVALGTGLGFAVYEAAANGLITGSAPSDQAKNRYERADGFQPYSVKIGDQWVSYSRLDPFASTIAVAADLATKADGMSDKQLDNYSMLLVSSVMKNMADKTWLSGISDFTLALQDPERYGPDYLRRLGASYVVPNLVNGMAQAADPVARERDTFVHELQSRIPGLSDSLLPKRDIWGRAITSEYAGPDFVSPIRTSRIEGDPVNAEMLKIGARNGPPQKTYQVGGVRKEWTTEQYDRLQALSAPAAYSGILELMSQPNWRSLGAPARRKAIDKVFEKARASAKAQILGTGEGFGETQGPRQPESATAGPSTTEGAWPGEPVASRDVVGELKQAIPGIRFTSGYRTPEYNASLRARGYHPANDSEHLDGAALDMLPPPGKSLSWLRAQVKRYDPKARLLVHDGHLHGGFNGFYDAPKLGGMAAR